MAELRLRDLEVGSMARITGIRPTHRSYRSKLLSMGLTRGAALRVERVAPLGDPILISIRGFELSLRRDEADALILEPLEGDPEEYGFFGGRHLRRRNGRHAGGSGGGSGGGRARGFGGGRRRRGPVDPANRHGGRDE